jgi:hypothetical protein
MDRQLWPCGCHDPALDRPLSILSLLETQGCNSTRVGKALHPHRVELEWGTAGDLKRQTASDQRQKRKGQEEGQV